MIQAFGDYYASLALCNADSTNAEFAAFDRRCKGFLYKVENNMKKKEAF